MRPRRSFAVAMIALLSSCLGTAAAAGLTVASPAFGDGDALPTLHRGAACGGGDVAPPITWSSAPPGTRSLALWMTTNDVGGGVRWLVYGLPVARAELRPGEGRQGDVGLVAGTNAAGVAAYAGPCAEASPAEGRVTVTLVATDLEPQALPAGLTLAQLQRRLRDHTLGSASIHAAFGP